MLRSQFLRKRWLALLCVILTAGTGWVLLDLSSNWCQALGHHAGFRMSTVKAMLLWNLVYAPGVLLFGAWCYRKLRVRWPLLDTTIATVVYFILLTLVAFPTQFGGLVLRGEERKLDETICRKSTSNGAESESKGLTVEEYEHLRRLNPYLPFVPTDADSLRVYYYSDGFLPDFSVHVVCAVKRTHVAEYPAYHELSRDGPTGWMRDTTRVDPDIAWLVYADGES